MSPSFIPLFLLALPLPSPSSSSPPDSRPRPIVPSAIFPSDSGPSPPLSDRTHALGQRVDSFIRTAIEGRMGQMGEKAMAKLREMKMMVPEKGREVMDSVMEIVGRRGKETAKDKWDEVIKNVEASSGLTGDERRQLYEKIAWITGNWGH